jgi:kynurenine 3-monooxygenase
MADRPEFTVVGAGLAGALLACHLGRAGRRVDVYERRPDPRRHAQERGRSINLALSVRGIAALREVGLADDVLHSAIPMRGRMIHSPAGRLTFQPYGKDQTQAINSVSRGGLNLTLIQAAATYP